MTSRTHATIAAATYLARLARAYDRPESPQWVPWDELHVADQLWKVEAALAIIDVISWLTRDGPAIVDALAEAIAGQDVHLDTRAGRLRAMLLDAEGRQRYLLEPAERTKDAASVVVERWAELEPWT